MGHAGREGLSAPTEGPYVLGNNQVVESGKWSETSGGRLKIPDRVRNSKGERRFSFRNRSLILAPFSGVCRLLAFLKG